jgi:hypothetical protein
MVLDLPLINTSSGNSALIPIARTLTLLCKENSKTNWLIRLYILQTQEFTAIYYERGNEVIDKLNKSP